VAEYAQSWLGGAAAPTALRQQRPTLIETAQEAGGLSGLVQAFSDGVREFLGFKGFGQKIEAFLQ